MGQTTRLLLLKLAEVFDFSNTQWVESVQSAQDNSGSFEKELEFFFFLRVWIWMRKALIILQSKFLGLSRQEYEITTLTIVWNLVRSYHLYNQ